MYFLACVGDWLCLRQDCREFWNIVDYFLIHVINVILQTLWSGGQSNWIIVKRLSPVDVHVVPWTRKQSYFFQNHIDVNTTLFVLKFLDLIKDKIGSLLYFQYRCLQENPRAAALCICIHLLLCFNIYIFVSLTFCLPYVAYSFQSNLNNLIEVKLKSSLETNVLYFPSCFKWMTKHKLWKNSLWTGCVFSREFFVWFIYDSKDKIT